MKTVADFKRRMKVGVKLHAINHLTFAGRDQVTGKVIYKDRDLGIRPVSIVQSNSFALETILPSKDGEQHKGDSWCSWPKATECIFVDENTVTILEEQSDKTKVPVLTYRFVD